jgi:3-deoxy-manno-octulosonate cytidylyltransferase (CMP-KDO synthetase)
MEVKDLIETLAVIPARYGSTRLPAKPLMEIGGVPLVIRVLRNALRCRGVDRTLVATDDDRIASVVEDWGGEAMMTPKDLPSGGDRVAYVAERIESRYVLNIQGDDPLVGPEMVDPLMEALKSDPSVPLAVLAKRIERPEEIDSPDIVKMVFDKRGNALYFSRSPIPYRRVGEAACYKHIGPYAYRRDFLLRFSSWDQTELERSESLEMLRVLERGYPIRCVETYRDTIEIDTMEDVKSLERYLQEVEDE